MVKNQSAMQETWVQSLGWEDPLEGGHGNPLQNSLSWRIPWTEEPGTGSQRVRYDWSTKHSTFFIWLLWVLVATCGIQLPDQGSNPVTLHKEHGILVTGPWGNSWGVLNKLVLSQFYSMKVKWVSFVIHNKSLATIPKFMLMRWLLTSTKSGTGGQRNQPHD